eukprot:TRINITY_DN5927_c0_g1_i1.p1 TRINITY_DN5927_c0_g1~~TRINITY_DN5927_c0_g1_i1.p1  ORF type:complete len:752 (-),score=187.73 TRINITY_DN5927_c0_g1_i1:96-2279(-)
MASGGTSSDCRSGACGENSCGYVYPQTEQRSEFSDDPYRWLEDPDAPDVCAWVEAQNKVTFLLLDSCPYRQRIKERLTEVYNYPKYSCTFRKGDRYFFYANNGLQPQSVLYVQDSLEGEERVLFDPNKLSEDGTKSLGVTAFSKKGDYFSYGISASGSDWQVIHILNVNTSEHLPETLNWIKFSSIAWLHDDSGFFYVRYPALNGKAEEKIGTEHTVSENAKVFFHKLNTEQEADVLVYEDPANPKWFLGVEVSLDGKLFFLTVYEGCKPANKLYYTRLTAEAFPPKQADLVKLSDTFDWEYQYLVNEGDLLYVKTNHEAPRNKIISIDLNSPEEAHWHDVIAEGEDVMHSVLCVNHNFLIVCYSHDVQDLLSLHRLRDGAFIQRIPLPDIGSVDDITGRVEDSEVFYSFSSFLYPTSIFHLEFPKNHANGDIKLSQTTFRLAKVPGIDPSYFSTQQVFYKSKDGTRVPMFVVAKKGLPLNGANPTLLYGYGGFNIAMTPSFNALRLVFMRHFGVAFALANIRGGSEYGEEWHQQALFGKKQNVFDDFEYAARYLIDNKYTSSDKLAILGGSNGGLLVGACMNQHPELYGCAVAQVGVMDMLRYHLFTCGHAWTTEYGCADVPEQRDYLLKYSPVHNVRGDVPYPALLLTTGDHDDRVVPLHSYKYIATVQQHVGSKPFQQRPLMIRVDVKAGHGGGKPTQKAIEEVADIYTFMANALHLTWEELPH